MTLVEGFAMLPLEIKYFIWTFLPLNFVQHITDPYFWKLYIKKIRYARLVFFRNGQQIATSLADRYTEYNVEQYDEVSIEFNAAQIPPVEETGVYGKVSQWPVNMI